MAEPSRDHPGFAWIMVNLEALMADYPGRWVVADMQGFVTASDREDELFNELRDRQPGELAIVYMDPMIMRAAPPDPRDLPPLAGLGGGGATFDQELVGAR
jgi:hypothetical protein